MKTFSTKPIFIFLLFFPFTAHSFNVSGRVVHEINQTPVANVGVLLVSSMDSTKFYHVKTSGDGTFFISNVSAGKYYLHADGGIGDFRYEEYLYTKTWYPNSKTISGATLLNVNKDLSNLTITISGQFIKGSIFDLATNNPLSNVVIRLYNQKWGEIQSINTKGEKYCFGSLPPGNYYVGYTDADYMTQYYNTATNRITATLLRLDNQKPGFSDIHFFLSSGISVSGKVTTSSGSGIANTCVALLREPALDWWNYLYRDSWTNASGEYTLSGIEPGEYYLIATGKGMNPINQEEQQIYPPVFYNNTYDPSQAQRIQIHTNLNHFDFVLKNGYFLSGKAYCIDGANPVPIPNLWIYVVLSDETYVNMMLTDRNGAFRFDGLAERDYVVKTHGIVNSSMHETYEYQYYRSSSSIQTANVIHLDRDVSNIDLMLHSLNFNPGDTTHYNPGDTTNYNPGDTVTSPGAVVQTPLSKAWVFSGPGNHPIQCSFAMDKHGEIILSLFDAKGKLIGKPDKRFLDKGIHKIELPGSALNPGIYLLMISFEDKAPIIQKFQSSR
ncbi:MAG TPA: carboxypeptidase-like regulatory domain-containing protein [Prolixibacteraceae bacterium]|nr:carboxypeptidase-like regulatory domain-containing protein [Prolixibacteraceae bacterium]